MGWPVPPEIPKKKPAPEPAPEPFDEAFQDFDVLCWRFDELTRHGWPPLPAMGLAENGEVDLHQACELLEHGATVDEALRILL